MAANTGKIRVGFLAVVAALIFLIATTAGYAEETKIPLSSDDVTIEAGKTYTISNKDELFRFSALVKRGEDFKDTVVELTSDITVEEGELGYAGKKDYYNPTLNGEIIIYNSDIAWWQPIGDHYGTHLGAFSGIFEGNNHVIKGLIGISSDSGGSFALFGRCDGAVIRNVTVENVYFRGYGCAGICAYACNGVEITNCHVINGIFPSRGSCGGIFGRTDFNSPKKAVKIEGCTSSCIIFEGCFHSSGISSCDDAGGIAGAGDNLKIKNCTSYSTITGSSNIGTILGRAGKNVVVENCANKGKAVGTASVNEAIGNKLHSHVFADTQGTILQEPTLLRSGTASKRCTICGDDFNVAVAPEERYHFIYEKDKAYYEPVTDALVEVFAKEGYTIKEVLLNGEKQVSTLIEMKAGDTLQIITQSDADKKQQIMKGISATKIKAEMPLTASRVLRVCWEKSAGYAVDYYQIFRSTKKSSGYGKKPIYTTKTGKVSYYNNTKSVKKGVRYYYKVRGVRVIDGKKYYTQWSNKVSRVKK